MKITDSELLNQTLSLVKREKELTYKILLNLLEIERRKLYSDLKYPSLFKYIVRELGYSDAEAQIRILAMKLISESELASTQIITGQLTLTQAAEVSKCFYSKRKRECNFSG